MWDKLLLQLAALLEKLGAFLLGYKLAKQDSEIQQVIELAEAKETARKVQEQVGKMTDDEIKQEANKYAR